jgi:hypothetical protein
LISLLQELMATQTEAIREINDVFEIPPMTAKSLLQHFNWDKDRLLERYVAPGYGSGGCGTREARSGTSQVPTRILLT